jgi:hypothetical protein
MEDILAIVFIFGGGTAIVLAFSPVGRALADRIRHRDARNEPDPAVQEELARLREEVTELQERVDFAERVLAQRSEPNRLPAS